MNLSEFIISDNDPLIQSTSTHKPADQVPSRINGEFLKGPIPLSWLTPASNLPGKALQVGLAIWFEYGRRNKTTFKLSSAILGRFNIGRKAGYRGLEALEDAELISVVRQLGKNPEITLLY